MNKKKFKTYYIYWTIIAVCFGMIFLGHLEHHRWIPAVIYGIFTIISIPMVITNKKKYEKYK